MKQIYPIRDKVLGRMLDPVGGAKTTAGGVIVVEQDMTDGAIRPRWFEVTHVGPEQQDVVAGQYVLVPHGRWSRGLDVNGTHRVEDFVFLIDHTDILGIQDDRPVS